MKQAGLVLSLAAGNERLLYVYICSTPIQPYMCIYLLILLCLNCFFFMYIEERMVQELVLKAYIRSIESTRILLFFIF